MGTEGIKKKFDDIHKELDSLQDSGATFMFIGHEGNHFVISGSPVNIEAQIVFSMMHYPVVRDIIKTCVARFDELNNCYGDAARRIEMDHLIKEIRHRNN